MSRILLGGAITIMRQERPKLVLTFDTPGTGTGKARIASRWAARRAAKVTSVSDNLSARLVGSGRVSRSESISNGVDTKRFTPEGSHFGLWEQYSFLDGTLLIGQVARIDQNKRQIDLVEALPLQLLRTDLAHSALVFAGNGQNRSAIEQLVASVGNVKVIPRVVDVASFLPELDIFCPLFRGRKCSARTTRVHELCKGDHRRSRRGYASHLGRRRSSFHQTDPTLLAQAILRLSASKEFRARLGGLARQRAL